MYNIVRAYLLQMAGLLAFSGSTLACMFLGIAFFYVGSSARTIVMDTYYNTAAWCSWFVSALSYFGVGALLIQVGQGIAYVGLFVFPYCKPHYGLVISCGDSRSCRLSYLPGKWAI